MPPGWLLQSKKVQGSREPQCPGWCLPDCLSLSSWVKAQYFWLNPSFVLGPTMTLLTLPSTPTECGPSPPTLLPADSTQFHQPTFSLSSHSHSFPSQTHLSHSYHNRTQYILYFLPGRACLSLLTQKNSFTA